MAQNPWLDERRFPARKHLAAARRDHTPLLAHLMPETGSASAVRAAWAAQLTQGGQPVDPADLLLCGSDREALELALGRLLAAGDVAVWAEPIAAAPVLATLAAGARYLHVGRRGDGALDPLTLALAARAHPDAVAYVEVPSLTSEGDLDAWHNLACRAIVANLAWQPWPTALPDVDACVLALRDPGRPADVALFGVVVRRGWGPGVELLHGSPLLSERGLQRALAIVQGCQLFADRTRSLDRELDALANAFLRDCAQWPGAQPVGRMGLRAAVRCLGGDPQVLGERLKDRYLGLRAEAHHPGGNLLSVDLTQQMPVALWVLNEPLQLWPKV